MTSSDACETSSRDDGQRVCEIDELHRRCGIYTRPAVVRRILDAVGWRAEFDLSRATLLEPAAGDGAFVVEAGLRLIESCLRYGHQPRARVLTTRIRAFELHPREVQRARVRVKQALRKAGLPHRTAESCAQKWIVESDFLLTDLPSNVFTHTVGNPPYVRWSKIPTSLKAKYSSQVPRDLTGGDLFLPFLDRALAALRLGGKCGFLCSDRWRYMGFAEGFRRRWLSKLDIHSEEALLSEEAFDRSVDSYPSVLIASKRVSERSEIQACSIRRTQTLPDLGCVIKVGPALGHTPAFVLQPGEDDVEVDLLRPWLDGSEIKEGQIAWQGRRVVALHEDDGSLLELDRFPLLAKRLGHHRESLSRRSIVRAGAPWYRSIDRVRAVDWARPKLVLPELAKLPRLAIDRSGAIPSHGVYAIFAPDDDVEAIYEMLGKGKLAQALEGISPRVKGGYVRCYGRFLRMLRIPVSPRSS